MTLNTSLLFNSLPGATYRPKPGDAPELLDFPDDRVPSFNLITARPKANPVEDGFLHVTPNKRVKIGTRVFPRGTTIFDHKHFGLQEYQTRSFNPSRDLNKKRGVLEILPDGSTQAVIAAGTNSDGLSWFVTPDNIVEIFGFALRAKDLHRSNKANHFFKIEYDRLYSTWTLWGNLERAVQTKNGLILPVGTQVKIDTAGKRAGSILEFIPTSNTDVLSALPYLLDERNGGYRNDFSFRHALDVMKGLRNGIIKERKRTWERESENNLFYRILPVIVEGKAINALVLDTKREGYLYYYTILVPGYGLFAQYSDHIANFAGKKPGADGTGNRIVSFSNNQNQTVAVYLDESRLGGHGLFLDELAEFATADQVIELILTTTDHYSVLK